MNKKTLNNIAYVLLKTWKYERSIIFIVVLQVIVGVLVPFISIYIPTTILNGVIGLISIHQVLIKIACYTFILAICNCINSYITSVYETHLLNNKIHFLTDLFRKKMELEYSFIESGTGQTMYQHAMSTLLNDNQGISGMIRTLGILLSNICNILFYMGIIGGLDFKVVIVLVVTSFIHLIILKRILKKQYSKKDFCVDIDRKINYLMAYIQEDKNNKDIKMFSMQGWLDKVTDTLINKRLNWVKKLADYNLLAAISDIALLIIRDGVAYFFIFRAILGNEIEVSQFVFYFGIITSFSIFMTDLTSNLAYVSQKSREISDIRQYLEIYDTDKAVQTMEVSNDSLCIELDNVSFRYDKDSYYILKDFNLIISKGEKVALVGDNGAGKTTLVKLICGLYKPTKGRILVNGVNINQLSQNCIGDMFATVFQDLHILPMSIAENIAFDDAGRKSEEIKKCIKLLDFTDTFSDIHTPVTKMLYEDGIVLSGGQEQQLVLARAAYKMIYKSAPALILDEPTAALDPIAEKQFYEKYNTIAEGKTSIFISHRLASTRFCDRIILLDRGRIIETGTHRQLIANQGKYKKLYDIQSRYYK